MYNSLVSIVGTLMQLVRRWDTNMIVHTQFKNKVVPELFSSNCFIVEGDGGETYMLRSSYRQENSPEFKYFRTRILGVVSPKQTEFK